MDHDEKLAVCIFGLAVYAVGLFVLGAIESGLFFSAKDTLVALTDWERLNHAGWWSTLAMFTLFNLMTTVVKFLAYLDGETRSQTPFGI